MNRFVARVAIVTGAASGIGAAIVNLLAREGAQVIAVDIDGDALTHNNPNITNQVCDMTADDDVGEMVETVIARHGRIDLLFNNAGTGSFCETPDLTNAAWEKVFAINVTAVMYACRAIIPHMRRQGSGAIVNTASISGLFADYGFDAYNASKGALVNYTRAMAIDHARDGIRINAFCPGLIAGTRLTSGLDPLKPVWEEMIPIGRSGTAEEMAEVAAFLASDAASYLVGSVLVADGGVTAHTGQPNLVAMTKKQVAART